LEAKFGGCQRRSLLFCWLIKESVVLWPPVFKNINLLESAHHNQVIHSPVYQLFSGSKLKHQPLHAGSTTHKDAFQGWKLAGSKRESLGIATVGDRLHVLIPSQLASPVSNKQVEYTGVKE